MKNDLKLLFETQNLQNLIIKNKLIIRTKLTKNKIFLNDGEK